MQNGANAPVATVLENTFNAPIVWSRTSPGVYSATLNNAFVEDKTIVYAPTMILDPFNGVKNMTISFTNSIITLNLDGNELSDGWFGAAIGAFSNKYPIEIRVYN